MYERDVAKIAAHGLASDQGLVDVIEFVLCTIQQPLGQVRNQRDHIALHGLASKFLFGSKRAGMAYAMENSGYLRRVALDILKRDDNAERKADLIQHFMQVPGLGMVKAAFVVQCLGGGTACLDTHNLKALGMSEAAVKIGKVKPETARKKVLAYVNLCDETGGSAYWWNRWCDYVAGRMGNKMFANGDEVSAFHWSTIAMV